MSIEHANDQSAFVHEAAFLKNLTLTTADSSDEAWMRCVHAFGGNIYHSPEWAEIGRTTWSSPLFFRCMDDEGRCMGIALGIETRSPKPLVGHFLKRLDFETVPAVEGHDVELARTMVGKLAEFARTGGYRDLSLQSYCANVSIPDLDRLGLTEIPRIEFHIDLSGTDEERWKLLSSHHQRKIKKARKHGLVLEEASTVEDMQELRQLQMGSRDRRAQRGEHFGLQDEQYYEHLGRQYFGNGLGRLFFIRFEGRRISAAFVSSYAGRALYVLGGSEPKGFELDAPAILFWELFDLYRRSGCREFNLGGVPASAIEPDSQAHGLYRFKAGFGAKQMLCFSGVAEDLHSGVMPILRAAKKAIGL
jgi:Acetyltransferase (GNAT) domain